MFNFKYTLFAAVAAVGLVAGCSSSDDEKVSNLGAHGPSGPIFQKPTCQQIMIDKDKDCTGEALNPERYTQQVQSKRQACKMECLKKSECQFVFNNISQKDKDGKYLDTCIAK